ncbi:hypothetical protein AAMO2058_001603900 [Amorphochlora amoebiformis]
MEDVKAGGGKEWRFLNAISNFEDHFLLGAIQGPLRIVTKIGNQVWYPVTKMLICALEKGIVRLRNRGKISDEHKDHDILKNIVRNICNVEVSIDHCKQALSEGKKMSHICDHLDRSTRKIIYRENYLFGSQTNLQMSASAAKCREEYSKRQKRKWVSEGQDPFQDFAFTLQPKMLEAWPRMKCSSCGKTAKVFCPRCLVPLNPPAPGLPEAEKQTTNAEELEKKLEFRLPEVKLPFNVDILLHPQENRKKATALHLCVLAPKQCRVLKFPEDLPNYDPKTTVLLFPDEKSSLLSDQKIDVSNLKTLLVVESTWQKANGVARHPKLQHIPTVRIEEKEGTFWRHQELGKGFLSTLEATYYFLIDHFKQARYYSLIDHFKQDKQSGYDRRYDDLMVIYTHMHRRITRLKFSGDGKKAKKDNPPASEESRTSMPKHWIVDSS